MQTLKAGPQLDVDQIIEKVMIRNTAQPYNYSKQDNNRLTPHEHLWHFQLQQENVELKAKIKELKRTCQHRQQVVQRQKENDKELIKVKSQFEGVVRQNMQLQRDLNRFRVKNSHSESIQGRSDRQGSQGRLDRSGSHGISGRSKSKRECSCSEYKLQKVGPQKIYPRKYTTPVESPAKDIIKTTENASTNCRFPALTREDQLQKRREQVNNLKRLIANQQTLISSYQQELGSKDHENALERKYTRPSTSIFNDIQRPTSLTTFKPQTLSCAGSIVKIKRN